MDTRKTRTWAEVSLGALRHNVEEMQRALPDGCGLLGVVKADAYGHGASEIAAALRECGCRYLAVACPQEALALRQAGETMPILILGAVDAAFASDMATFVGYAFDADVKVFRRVSVHSFSFLSGSSRNLTAERVVSSAGSRLSIKLSS